MPRIGDVIKIDDGLFVVTEMINEVVTGAQELEKYIIQNTMINVGDRHITLKEVIEEQSELFLSERKIIDRTQ